MRAYELLSEGSESSDYVNEIESALSDLLASAKANGSTEIPTEFIVSTLNGSGYNVDIESIMNILSENPFVQVATSDVVTLVDPDGAGVSGDGAAAETNRDRVRALAQKAAGRDIN